MPVSTPPRPAVLDPGAGTTDRPFDGLADRLDLNDVLLHHRIGRQRLDCIVLDPIAASALGELQQLDGGGADVHADQRCLGSSE